MIVYRIQAAGENDWPTTFEALKADALREGKSLAEVFPVVHVDELEVPGGRAGVVEALRLAHVNRSVWPGVEVWRSKR